MKTSWNDLHYCEILVALCKPISVHAPPSCGPWWDACAHRQLIIVAISHYCPLKDLVWFYWGRVGEGGGVSHPLTRRRPTTTPGADWWEEILLAKIKRSLCQNNSWYAYLPRLDEIADIWIRRIIKAIRLQLNCFSSGGTIFFMCQEGWAFRVKRQQVCVRACTSTSVQFATRPDLWFEYPL